MGYGAGFFFSFPGAPRQGQRRLSSLCGAAVQQSIALSAAGSGCGPGARARPGLRAWLRVRARAADKAAPPPTLCGHKAGTARGQRAGGWWPSRGPRRHSCGQCRHSSPQYGVTPALSATCSGLVPGRPHKGWEQTEPLSALPRLSLGRKKKKKAT